VAALTRQLNTAVTDPILRRDPQQQARLIKYLVNTLLLLFNSRSTAKKVTQPILSELTKYVCVCVSYKPIRPLLCLMKNEK
jgi:hypothetical protein